MRYSNRLFLYAPFVILLFIAALAMLRWHELARHWETRLLAANGGSEIAPGVTLHFASETIGGFPFNLDIVLNKFVVAVRSTRGPISFASERFAIHALTYGRAQQVMEAAGLQTLDWTDTNGEKHSFSFVPGSLRASAIEKGGRLTRFDLDLNAFGSSSLTGAGAQFHVRSAPDRDALDIAIRAEDLHMKPAGAVLPHIELDGRIAPAAPLAHLLAARDEWRSAVENWRADNGALHIDRIAIDRDTSHVDGNGLLVLDENNRISGAMNLLLSDASRWKPMHAGADTFTSALQELTNATPAPSPAPLSLSLDIHNGAAILRAAGRSHGAGTIDPMF